MNNIDNIIRSKLVDHTADYPDFLWDNIAKEIGTTPKAKPFAWRPFAGVAALALLGVVVFFIWNQSGVHKSDSFRDKMSVNESNKQNKDLLVTTAEKDEDAQVLDESNKSDLMESKESLSEESKVENVSPTSKVNVNKSYLKNTNNSSASNEKSSMNFVLDNLNSLSNTSIINNTSKSSGDNYVDSFSNETLVQQQTAIATNLDQFQNRDFLKFDFLKNTENPSLFELERSLAKYPYRVECPPFKKSGNLFAIEVYGSLDMPFKSLTAKNDADLLYKEARLTTESRFLSVSTGIRGSFYITNNLALRTGVEVGFITEKFEYVDPDSRLIETTIREIKDDMGNIIELDTSYIERPGSRSVRKYNTITAIGIPIQIGLEKNVNRFILGVNGGIMLDMINYNSGKILDPNLDIVQTSSNNTSDYDLYKDDFGLSIKADFSLGMRIRENSIFLIEPNVKYYLKSVTMDSHPLEQRLFTVGLRTGLRFHF